MASKSMLLRFAFLFLIFCYLQMEINPLFSYCGGGENGCISATASGLKVTHNRKFLSRDGGAVESGGGMKMVEWERDMMRRVPSGPDPLHHNGAKPEKPRSP